MDRTERFYKIDQLLRQKRVTPLRELMEELGVSRATVKRDIQYLRDRLYAPIVWNRHRQGYQYENSRQDFPRFSLPGLWFNSSEVYALLAMEHMLMEIEPDLLRSRIKPLHERIRKLLGSGGHSADEITRRIRVPRIAVRSVNPRHFQAISGALLVRKRLFIQHYNRVNGEKTEREVSPQRLVYYRDNWYMDGWCHLRKDVRSFSVDALSRVEFLDKRAKDVKEEQLDRELHGYGIFSGSETRKAVLRFTPERARWVSREVWHPAQQSHFDEKGGYVLAIDYSDDRELIMDIMKYGPDVEVLEPPQLRRKIHTLIEQTREIYRK